MSKMTCVTCCGSHYLRSRTHHALQALRTTYVVTLLALQHFDQTGATAPVRRIQSGTKREQTFVFNIAVVYRPVVNHVLFQPSTVQRRQS